MKFVSSVVWPGVHIKWCLGAAPLSWRYLINYTYPVKCSVHSSLKDDKLWCGLKYTWLFYWPIYLFYFNYLQKITTFLGVECNLVVSFKTIYYVFQVATKTIQRVWYLDAVSNRMLNRPSSEQSMYSLVPLAPLVLPIRYQPRFGSLQALTKPSYFVDEPFYTSTPPPRYRPTTLRPYSPSSTYNPLPSDFIPYINNEEHENYTHEHRITFSNHIRMHYIQSKIHPVHTIERRWAATEPTVSTSTHESSEWWWIW